MKPLLFAFALVVGLGSPLASQTLPADTDEPRRIEFIDVRGNRLVPRDTILFNMQTSPGGILRPDVVARDIRTLYSLGSFEDIRVESEPGEEADGVVLVVYVEETPRVGDIEYVGLSSVTESDLLDRYAELGITVQRELPYDQAMVRRAQVAIRDMLAIAGRQNAVVDVEVYELGLSRVGIEFIIDEGPKIKIEQIELVGNEVFTDSQLKGALELLKETGPIVSFKGLDLYHEEKLRFDVGNNLLGLYRANGYVRANVLEPEVEVRPHFISRTLPLIKPSFPWGIPLPFWKKQVDRYFIRLEIEENEQYRVGEVQVTGNNALSDELIIQALGLVPGEVYDEGAMREGFDALIDIYGQRGFINFSPVPLPDYDDENRLVNVTISIEEDRQFFVTRINFRGNTTTRDNVIRREFILNEGDPFNSNFLDLSILRVNQLGYFEPIEEDDYEVRPSVTDPEVEITVNVEERGRNSIGFTGGVSGIGGSFLGINYETNNFLGMGETLSVAAQGGTRQSNYVFSFTEPYLFDRPISAGFSVFSTEYRFDQARDVFGVNPDDLPQGLGFDNLLNFEQSRKGFSLFTSYPLALFQRLGLTFQWSDSSTSAVNQATSRFFEGVQQSESRNFVETGGSFDDFRMRAVSPSYTYNTVNNPNFPTQGHSVTFNTQFTGGFLGGNVNYYRPFFEYRHYRPMRGGRNTLAFRFQTSHISGFSGTSAPFFERFRMGGDFDIRGFNFQAIMPFAWIEEQFVDPFSGGTFVQDRLAWIGGDTMALANLEYRIPLGGQMFTLAPFLDVGNTWALKRDQLRREVTLPDGTVRRESVRFVEGTNSGLRASTGIELQVMMPVINAPFRLLYHYNPLRLDGFVTGPATGTQFLFQQEEKGFKFTIGRTF